MEVLNDVVEKYKSIEVYPFDNFRDLGYYQSNLKHSYYEKTMESRRITVDKYLKEKYDLDLDMLEKFIEKYEPERLIL